MPFLASLTSMSLTAECFRDGIERIRAGLPELETELNAADALLGDGDTGGMIGRVVTTIAAAIKPDSDLEASLATAARAAASATGSSLGTLVAIGLLTSSRFAKGKQSLSWTETGAVLEEAAAAMLKRGNAAIGDKTVVDAVAAVAKALLANPEPAMAGAVAIAGAQAALDEFRQRPCRIGRARMFAERSIGMDDPGMLAVARIVERLAVAPAG